MLPRVMSEATVVFKSPASLLDVIDVADEEGWQEIEHFRRGERQLEEVIYQLPDGETIVRAIDDHFVIVVFAAISGPARAAAEERLRRRPRSLEAATLWQWAENPEPEQRAFALRAFAATSQSTADAGVVSLYERAVGDENPLVREALIEAVGRAAWRELWPVVDELARSGDEESRRLKEAYERHLPRSG